MMVQFSNDWRLVTLLRMSLLWQTGRIEKKVDVRNNNKPKKTFNYTLIHSFIHFIVTKILSRHLLSFALPLIY